MAFLVNPLQTLAGDSPIQVFFTAGHAALLGGVGGTGGGPRGGHGAKPQKNPFATPVRGVPGSKGARSSRVSGRPGGMALIRKYGIMMKRQDQTSLGLFWGWNFRISLEL